MRGILGADRCLEHEAIVGKSFKFRRDKILDLWLNTPPKKATDYAISLAWWEESAIAASHAGVKSLWQAPWITIGILLWHLNKDDPHKFIALRQLPNRLTCKAAPWKSLEGISLRGPGVLLNITQRILQSANVNRHNKKRILRLFSIT